MKMLRFGAVLLLLCGMAFASTASFTQPRLAIFLSKTSYRHAWETSRLPIYCGRTSKSKCFSNSTVSWALCPDSVPSFVPLT